MSNITEPERSEEAQRQIEERFRRLVEVMPVAVYVCDKTGIIQNYNQRAVELWGRERRLGDPAQRHCGSRRLYSPDGKLVPHEESKMAEVLRTGIKARDGVQKIIQDTPVSVTVKRAPNQRKYSHERHRRSRR